MDTLEKWPSASWHIVPRRDGALSNVYCGGSPVALCVPDELSHMLKAAPAMLAALKEATRVMPPEHRAWIENALAVIRSAEGR